MLFKGIHLYSSNLLLCSLFFTFVFCSVVELFIHSCFCFVPICSVLICSVFLVCSFAVGSVLVSSNLCCSTLLICFVLLCTVPVCYFPVYSVLICSWSTAVCRCFLLSFRPVLSAHYLCSVLCSRLFSSILACSCVF